MFSWRILWKTKRFLKNPLFHFLLCILPSLSSFHTNIQTYNFLDRYKYSFHLTIFSMYVLIKAVICTWSLHQSMQTTKNFHFSNSNRLFSEKVIYYPLKLQRIGVKHCLGTSAVYEPPRKCMTAAKNSTKTKLMAPISNILL